MLSRNRWEKISFPREALLPAFQGVGLSRLNAMDEWNFSVDVWAAARTGRGGSLFLNENDNRAGQHRAASNEASRVRIKKSIPLLPWHAQVLMLYMYLLHTSIVTVLSLDPTYQETK